MTTRTLDAVLPRVDVEQASHHLRLLHSGGEGFIALVLLGAGKREFHEFTPIEELWRAGDRAASSETLQDVVDDRWNVYAMCSTLAQLPAKGRGSRSDVQSTPGVWVDIDVKPDVEGYFKNSAEADAFIAQLPRPTLVVESGSGGRHGYWLVHDDDRPDGPSGEHLLQRWRDYLLDQAGPYALDYVHDTTRILRLAGTVRWPKAGEQSIGRVEIIGEGPRYHRQELELITQPAWEAARDVRRARREANAQREKQQRETMLRYGPDVVNAYDAAVTRFNMEQDWAYLLEQDGWTLTQDARDTVAACRYWTRPGKSASDGKSAATDWTDHDGMKRHSMTIYSRDKALTDISETLTDAGQVLCTKWIFAKVRLFHGDESQLLASVVQSGGTLP